MQYGKIYSVAGNAFKQVNLFRNFSFVICLLDLFDNRVIEQVYYINVSEFEWQFFDLFKVPP